MPTNSSKPKKEKRSFANKDVKPANKRGRKGWQPTSWDEVKKKGMVEADHVEKPKTDEAKLYPAPSEEPEYQRRWYEFLPDIVKRENFKPGHLEGLRMLCDLYVEADMLQQTVKRDGFTYKSVGRNGTQYKARPEVMLLKKAQAEIRTWLKHLGLTLYKDKSTELPPTPGSDGDDW